MVAPSVLVALIITSLIIPGSLDTTALDDIKSADCISQKDLIEIVQWFFHSSRVLILVNLDTGDTLRDFQDLFVQQVTALHHAPVIHANGTDLSWAFGEKTGVLLIGHSFETIRRLFDRLLLSRPENINRNGDFMFAVVSPELNPDWSSALVGDTLGMARFFRGLWTDFNILNAVVVVASCGSRDTQLVRDVDVGYYDPFEYVGGFELANEQSWGKFYWTRRSALRDREREFITKRYIGDFRGYPLKVNQFPRYPTAIDRSFIPPMVQNSYIYNKCEGSDLLGHDGLVLRNLELQLNFSKQNVPVTSEYGWLLDNGTFVGSIGNILRKDIDVSFNGRFIKYYDTFDVNFMTPVLFENFCIVAPKALKIPEYLRIFQCFRPTVWVAIVIINLILGGVWFSTKKILLWISIRPQAHSDTIAANELTINRGLDIKFQFWETVIEMWNIMLSAPSNQMPHHNVERILLTFCLLANLNIIGIFQGSLTTAFSTVTYYKDINSLQEVDDSSLPISVGSKSIMDIFGTGGSALIQSLAAKMELTYIPNTTSLSRAATRRNCFGIERKADLNVIINTKFVEPGGRPLLNVVQECPRDYYVAYLTRAGWPLLPTFNWSIQKFFEAGFIQKWYEVTEKAIIEHYRLTTPGEDESMKPLSLLDIQTSFLILGIGLTFSSVVFVSELLHSKCTRLALVPVQQDYYLVHEKESGINNKRLLSARQVELLN